MIKSLGMREHREERRQDVSRWFVFAALVALASLPNLLPWERHVYPTTYLIDLQERAVLALPLTALALTVFRAWHRSWCLLWVLFLWWMPVSLAVRWINESAITSSLFGIAVESTPGELMELAHVLAPGVVVGFVGFNLLCLCIFLVLRQPSDSTSCGRSGCDGCRFGLVVPPGQRS
jgi:hypothetical protein